MFLTQLFARLDSHQLLWILGFALPGVIIAVTAIAAAAWWRVRKAKLEVELKKLLIERGMSAEEIERVVRARIEGETD